MVRSRSRLPSLDSKNGIQTGRRGRGPMLPVALPARRPFFISWLLMNAEIIRIHYP